MRQRKQANFIAFLRGKGGLTLVEVIVSLLVLGILAIIVLSGNGAAFNLIKRGAAVGANAQAVYDRLETGVAAGESATSTGSISFVAEGKTYTVQGAYYEDPGEGQDDPAVPMTVFVPYRDGGGGSGQ